MSDLSSAVELLPLRALQDAVAFCLLKDQFRLRRLCRDLQVKPDQKKQQQLQADILASQAARQRRAEAMPRITYPAELPVVGRKDDIKAAIAAHQVVIIAGETGSGKTTQIPKICLELGRGVAGLIGHTQPRRLAARSVGQRLADELSVPLGQQVGYKVRFGDHTGANTLVKLMTDGILLAEIQQEKFLTQYDTIIIDEAHERSLNIDFLLG